MIHPIKARMSIELEKFKLLSPKARNLILSYFFQGASNPILGTFMNAFIWKIEGDFYSVAMFNLGNTIGLPITFLINGLLLRIYHIGVLYTFGSITLGLAVILVVVLAKIGIVNYLIFGIIFGVGYGLYWSNRNYLTLRQTKTHNRNYFLGINFTIDTATSIAVPFLVGWFIYLGGKVGMETYLINAVIAFLLLTVSGFFVLKGKYETPSVARVFIGTTTPKWKYIRLLTFALGIIDGLAFFVVSLIVLYSVGHEGILGSIDSLSSVFLGILFYYYGRKAGVHHQKRVYFFSVIVGILGSLFLLTGVENVLSAVLFTSLYYFSIAFIWLSTEPIMMDYLDEEAKKFPENRYALIVDRELFLNMGRWASMFIFFACLYYFGQKSAVTISPLITYLLHFVLIIPVFRVIRAKDE